ncbi:MAG: NrfD/PsrC family molybdoenzyme membrane anchor subunit [Thermoanaerobaculia bacterium]
MSPDSLRDDESSRPPLVGPGITTATVTDQISSVVLAKTPRWWFAGFAVAFALLMLFLFAVGNLFVRGVGIWGINIPVGWGWDIVNFVWWIGIGHAGTLISAILLLLRQTWRNSINRFAEAMTLFAVACAGMYPLLHLGRPQVFYFLFPYPNTMGIWPNFRSPLVWDVFAVSTYATISALFWYVGLIPDLATLRDRSTNPIAQHVYGLLAMGWRGSARHWHNYESASLMLAGLATPLVVSVHTVVSFDFAVGVIPGWHTTIFPPYFVAGAVYSGFAMVMTLCIPLRWLFKMEGLITMRHLQNMAKVMLTTGLIVAYGYAIELFTSWYSGNRYEWAVAINRIMGPYRWEYYALIVCNVLVPQLLWMRRIRNSVAALFIISIVVNVGMWLERFIIIVGSLAQDFLPGSWGIYKSTIWDKFTFIGTIGLFFSLMFLFIRFLPMISIFEMRTIVPEAPPDSPGGSAPPREAQP